ncbi:MAG TPA: amidohydrolase family protein [Candidatus Acidoferrales bacterium]|nr:amidohydrolase family protein [Candidatus Acidoferrales bacterium]
MTIGGKRAMTIDVHSHCIVDIRELVKDHEEGRSDPFLNPARQRFLDPAHVEDRLQHMDTHGIDLQAVSLFPSYSYWADRELAKRIVQLQNEKISELCAAHPDRFVGLGAVALQHPDLAVEQMDYAVKKLGMRGFEIEGSVNGEDLSAPKFEPFWSKAEELDILIFIHPSGFAEGRQQLGGNGFLTNVIGNPLETTVALSHLIFDGTLDRHPGLKICGAHGGGYLPSYLGRSNHCAEASGNCKPVKKKPSEYFREQLYCDSLVFSAEGLRHLIAEVGADHVLLGSDYPADIDQPHMGDAREVDSVLGVPGISDSDQRAILGENAAQLLGIKNRSV